jgi:hypothetical protein
MNAMFLLWMNSAEATTMVPLSVEQMVDLSSTVVRGTVTNVWTEPDMNTKSVWTYAQVEVDKVFKGQTQTQVLVLEQPGGSWGTAETIVEGVARFSVGEEGYFFVENLDSGRAVTAGMFQGKYNVIFDPYSRQELAVRFPVHPKRDFDHRFIPLPPEKQRMSVDMFESQIEAYVLDGWDGQPIPGVSLEKLEAINTPTTK